MVAVGQRQKALITENPESCLRERNAVRLKRPTFHVSG
jgi:hypothetical protein